MAIVVAGLAAGCAHGGSETPARQPAPRGKSRGGSVVVGPEAMAHGGDVLGGWLAYGSGRAAAYEKLRPPLANQSADDYQLELVGRQMQSEFWAGLREKGAAPFPQFDRQVEIWKAGFLPELLVSIYAHPGWTVPGPVVKALRLPQFAHRFPGDYETKLAIAVISPAGKKFPDVPGADFPDPAALPIHPDSCERLRDDRAAAWRRWDALTSRLGGVPVAARNPLQFAGALDRVKDDPAYLARGVTWVSWRVGHLAYLEGFCALEAKDAARAVETLTRAVGLTPTDVRPRLELGMALAMVKRYDEALVQDRDVIDHTADACTIATALRHEGFTYFDMGLLESARLAYEKSLEYEPRSPLAAQELKGIATALSARHDAPKEAAAFVPPASRSMLTECNKTKAP
ncbi:MAG TPA: hypothetical protein VGP07_01645 [Polyangia bacterium]